MTSELMTSREAIEAIAGQLRDQIVVTGIGAATHEWHRCFEDVDDQAFHVHTMGLATSVGLGLALGCPDIPVWVLEGDGGLALNFGTLLTLSSHQDVDLVCFIVNNRRYAIIQGGKWPNSDFIDLQGVASAAGIRQAFYLRSLVELREALPDLVGGSGLRFVVLDVDPDAQKSAPARYEGAEIKYRFARYMERRSGRPVLGDLGY